ncbi:apyrase-like [Acyrthosiphon pisum]|uniref:Uncharacterized protein n=1 Tax=Acyrthosiphon pisum TaxID=7029 RepID=A0A8R2NS65_ACYPI|nr:apyrase-like [Acyrthosiphon pisum]
MSIQLTNLLILASITTNIVFGAPATSVSDSNHNLITELIDTKYPITKPIKFLDGSVKYRIAIIADLDRNSVSPDEPDTWISYFKEGHLTYKPSDEKISIEWDDFESNGDRLKTNLSVNGRGAELSELVTYNSKLITLDDKTGYLYLIQNKILEPWVKVLAGNGQKDEGNNIHFALRYPLNA